MSKPCVPGWSCWSTSAIHTRLPPQKHFQLLWTLNLAVMKSLTNILFSVCRFLHLCPFWSHTKLRNSSRWGSHSNIPCVHACMCVLTCLSSVTFSLCQVFYALSFKGSCQVVLFKGSREGQKAYFVLFCLTEWGSEWRREEEKGRERDEWRGNM